MSLLPVSLVLHSAAAAGACAAPPAWIEAEKGILENHVQLTFSSRFIKAGESYFSPDDSKVIFQAVPVPGEGEEPEAFFQMYVADVVYGDGGAIAGLENYQRLSPPGSWNTCGWFHPTKPGVVIFGSTLIKPKDPEKVGFQRNDRGVDRYVWSFPKEMTIVECDLTRADGSKESLAPIVRDDEAYLAECVISDDGRYLVYCRRAERDGPHGGDLVIRDLATGEDVTVAGSAGYDGGPFFSPDGRRLCYRSDRRGDNLLQVFVAELEFDASGRIVGVEREFQLTDNGLVNWAPYWTRDGRHLVYTTSEHGHTNYEIFVIDADAGDSSAGAPTKYGTRKRRITHADKFDGLPAFNSSGSKMIWTSQRSDDQSSQLWAAEFVIELDRSANDAGVVQKPEDAVERGPAAGKTYVRDPETGMLFVYNVETHEVVLYDMATHKTTPVEPGSEAFQRALRLFKEQEEGD